MRGSAALSVEASATAVVAPGASVTPPRRFPAWLRPSRGFGLRAAIVLYMSLLVWLPVGTLAVSGLLEGPAGWWAVLTDSTARDALILSLWTAALAAVVQAIAGTAIAWALVRWDFPGRRLVAALVDLPLAVPTLVAGLLIVALFGPQSLVGGAFVAAGVPIAFAKPGIVLALLFVTLPFGVRAVQPVLMELDPAEEEAAVTLGASPARIFVRVLLPPLLPAILAGGVQTFARSVAEFGSLVAVSGNKAHSTLVAPVFIRGEIEAGHNGTAAVVSLLLLLLAVALQPTVRWLLARAGHRRG